MQNKLAKITASQDADQALDRMVKSTNNGFTGGRVGKNDMTSWIIMYFEERCFPDCLSKIREDHFDQLS